MQTVGDHKKYEEEWESLHGPVSARGVTGVVDKESESVVESAEFVDEK